MGESPSSHLPSSLTALSSLPPAPPFPTTVRRRTQTSSASTIYYLQPLPPLPAPFSPWLSCSAARRQALWQLSQVKWSAKAPSTGNSHPGCRLLTRSISITPSIIIAAAVGRDGLSAALNGTQIALSFILPFVSAPLIYFTCRNKYMTVSTDDGGSVKMRNHWITTVFAVLIWLIIVVMNVSLLVLVGLGKA